MNRDNKQKKPLKILLVVGYKTLVWMWNITIKYFRERTEYNITAISYADYSNYAYDNFDLYIFNSMACRLDIDENRLNKSVYLLPAFKVYNPYKQFIKNNRLYRKPISKIKQAYLQVNSKYKSVVSNNIIKAENCIDLNIRHFDFIFNPKHMSSVLIYATLNFTRDKKGEGL